MPAYIDARPPGINCTFRRGTTLTMTINWPAGTLAGRTFTATLNGVGLSAGIIADVMTITVTAAQTAAAADGSLPFVLTETTGDDQPILIGSWVASIRPSAVSQQTVQLTSGTSSVNVTMLAGVEGLPELVAGDPTEVGLVTVGDMTTLTLLEPIARKAQIHRSGEYYVNTSGTYSAQGLTQSRLHYCPVVLSAGTIDRIGCEVTTAQPAATIRLGVYTDNGGLPGNLIAECATPADASTTGVKDQTISAAIIENGLYWLAMVAQGAAGVAINGANQQAYIACPGGTSAPTGTAPTVLRAQASVTGALPATAAATLTGSERTRVHFRYV